MSIALRTRGLDLRAVPWLVLTTVLLLTAGCEGSESDQPAAQNGDAGDGDADGASTEPGDAILVAERVFLPEERVYYVSILPAVPSGAIDRSLAREFFSADIEIFDDHVYLRSRDDNTITRFSVSDDLELVEEGVVSFANTGLGTGRVHNAYVSPTRSYALDTTDWRMIEWNPTTMELTGDEISIEHMSKEGLPTGFIGPPRRVNDRVVVQVGWDDYDKLLTYPGMGATLVIDPSEDEPPALIEDDRLGSGFAVYEDAQGNAYLPGMVAGDVALFGSAFGGGELPPAGVVRIAAEAEDFDSDYFVNVSEITGSPAVWAIHWIDEAHLLVQLWDPETTTDDLENSEDFWAAGDFIYGIVDTEAETFSPIDSIPRGGVGNAYPHRVDGELYVQTDVDLGNDEFQSSVHVVTPTGTEEAFIVPSGDLWHLERIR